MPERFIADNILSVRLLMDLAQRYKLSGIGILLNQEKAYDRIRPDYLKVSLKRFGYLEDFISYLSSLFMYQL